MREDELRELVRRRLGLRVGPEMAAYLLQQIEQACPERSERIGSVPGGLADIPIIGEDARTGIPRHASLPAIRLAELLQGDEPGTQA